MQLERARIPLLLLALCVAIAGGGIVAGHASAESKPGGYVVIVHPDNPVAAVGKDFVQEAYLKKTVAWGSGETLRPVDLSKRFPARERFGREILKKTPVQLRSYWNQRIFSGKGSPPPELDSEAAVVGYVIANRGAIGYLPAGSDPGRARVVKVD
jgi:hypothetical protein